MVGFSLMLNKAITSQSSVILEMIKWLLDFNSFAFGWVPNHLNSCPQFEAGGGAHPPPTRRTAYCIQRVGVIYPVGPLLLVLSKAADSSRPEQPPAMCGSYRAASL